MGTSKLIYKVDKELNEFYQQIYTIHDNVNQKYGPYSYTFHLEMVKNIAMENAYEYIIGNYTNKDECAKLLLASIEHDLIEDTTCRYSDVYNLNINILSSYLNEDKNSYYVIKFSKEITEAVYALTDEKGRNRTERHNEKYWNEILENGLALYIKLCDIYANMLSSKYIIYNHKLYEMYNEEIHRIYNIITDKSGNSTLLDFCYKKIFSI